MLLVPAAGAFSYDLEPQWRSVDSREARRLENLNFFSSEYSSDYLTYLKPIDWQGHWLRSKKAYDLSFGSTSSSDFTMDQRIKVDHRLTDLVEMNFLWYEDRDLEEDVNQNLFGLTFGPWKSFKIQGVGSISSEKEENDVGGSIIRSWGESWGKGHETRLSYLKTDFQRERRSREGDSYVDGKKPNTLSLRHIWLSDDSDGFVDFMARWETPTHWRQAKQNEIYKFNRLTFQVLGYVPVSTLGFLGWRYYFEEKSESLLDDESLAVKDDVSRQRQFGSLEWTKPLSSSPWSFRSGLHYFQRRYSYTKNSRVARDLLPALSFFERASAENSWTWEFGYEMTYHDLRDLYDYEQGQPSKSRVAFEHRLNVIPRWNFSGGELDIVLSFDLDQFGSPVTWEGGAGRFRLVF